jgi:hypothetical protein
MTPNPDTLSDVLGRLTTFEAALDRDWTAALATAYDTDPGSEIRPYAEARAALKADLRTAISSLRGSGGWRPIEEAPKDGTPVDLWMRHEDRELRRADSCWDVDHQEWRFRDGFRESQYVHAPVITHFQPLPPPPEKGTAIGAKP